MEDTVAVAVAQPEKGKESAKSSETNGGDNEEPMNIQDTVTHDKDIEATENGEEEYKESTADQWYWINCFMRTTMDYMHEESCVLALGTKFNEFGKHEWVYAYTIIKIVDMETQIQAYNKETIEIVNGVLTGKEDGTFVAEKGIWVATLGLFGRASHMLKKLKACFAQADLVFLRENEKKKWAEDLAVRFKEGLRKAEANKGFLCALKAERNKPAKASLVLGKEAAANVTRQAHGVERVVDSIKIGANINRKRVGLALQGPLTKRVMPNITGLEVVGSLSSWRKQ